MLLNSVNNSVLQNHEVNLLLRTPEATKQLASLIASKSKTGDVICLNGELGSGKTTFSKGYINSFFLMPQQVASPTFNIMQSYEADNMVISHYDLYRIKDENELNEIGLLDSINTGIAIIEWPDVAKSMLPNEKLDIKFEHTNEENSRRISLIGSGSWSTMLKEMFS